MAIVYEIQGLADPNHPATKASLAERMAQVWDLACDVMKQTDYQPRDIPSRP